ncbi:hypothetical protein CLV30_114118 [Haloactinopolyspora alba]|uniref:Mce-associated membrane protein n=1 Tax=Haloactinopolyspora alba TaxID=648780 RepID=A0A2P8DVX3_9ACTN|nr:hypothetical protein [Haloactinopolyspora alba]PSL01388.1 hypothetical protein CLV30_114118 [Haloactinopolyspora alba]
MNGSHPRASRCSLVGIAVLGFVGSGCSAANGADQQRTEPDGVRTSSATTTSDTPVTRIEAAFSAYWDAVARAQRGDSGDPAELFEGVATDAQIQQNVAVAERYARQGLVRVGDPVISDVEVTLDDGAATVAACVDESEWRAVVQGRTLPPPDHQQQPHPVKFDVVKQGGTWLIGSPVDAGGTITC